MIRCGISSTYSRAYLVKNEVVMKTPLFACFFVRLPENFMISGLPIASFQPGYKGKGANASATRLLKIAAINARIAEILATISAAVIKAEIANRDWRVMQLHDITARLHRIRDARAKDPAILKAPGGDTGFVTVTVRTVEGSDGRRVPVIEHAVDTGLIREIKATLRQASEELGQLTQKHEAGGTTDGNGNPTGGPLTIVLTQSESMVRPWRLPRPASRCQWRRAKGPLWQRQKGPWRQELVAVSGATKGPVKFPERFSLTPMRISGIMKTPLTTCAAARL